MSPVLAFSLLVAIVLVATLVGVLLRRRDASARAVHADVIVPSDLAVAADAFGARATLVQFSTELCARCPAARRLLAAVAGERTGVAHVEVDLTHRPDIARRFGVLQTPTILVLDQHGAPRARIAGAPARATVIDELDRIAGSARV
jgi:thiol-disulfide isomerase/thioredoxin